MGHFCHSRLRFGHVHSSIDWRFDRQYRPGGCEGVDVQQYPGYMLGDAEG